MKNLSYLLLLLFLLGVQQTTKAQCEAMASASSYEIYCGQSVDLTGFGQSSGTVVLDENFDSGVFGAGWDATPGAVDFTNPCSPQGVDGTTHAWMGNNTSVPRTLISSPYDLTSATAGVTICFDLLFSEQGDASPCEGPDEPDEGVFLEYSIDGGATWVTIHYFDPNGGNDPQLVNWNNWCFQVPAAAITSSTQFRWHQTADSGAEYDHWGIDNVEIYQNDVNAELVWLHDNYSYGIGQPGGVHPDPVTPLTTTDYVLELTTGTNEVCTDTVTVVVLDPVYGSDLALDPSAICEGNCADFVGDVSWVIDPGGIETYENNQTEIVATGAAAVNINIQDLNMPTINPGSIQEICINDFNFSGTQICTNFAGCDCNGVPISMGDQCNIDASSFTITLSTPDGCEIVLMPAGEITSTGIQDMCFVPAGGAPISSGSGTYSDQFDPSESIAGLDGCQANGVWTLDFDAGGGFGFGFGSLGGWKITFDDPSIEEPVNHVWTPTTDMDDPSSINPEVCPDVTTDYILEVDNGVAGCATEVDTFTLIVDPCIGCTPPVLDISALSFCSPNTVDLNSAIGAGSDPANSTFYNTEADANSGSNAIGSTVSSSGSYWVRAENTIDPTCFEVFEIIVDATTVTASNSGPLCLGDFVDLTSSVSAGTVTTHSWTGPNGYNSSDENPTGVIPPGTVGSYDYTYSATINGSVCSATTSVTINDCQSSCDTTAIRDALTAAGCIELDACMTECSMYFLNPQTMTGPEAQNFAQGFGMNLVSIQSDVENDCILSGLSALGETGVIWIGLGDHINEGDFQWYDQSPYGGYLNWAPGEPNQSGNEDCVQIYPTGGNAGMWNDEDCDDNNSKSIIEVDLCPVVDAGPDITICEGETATMGSSETILGTAPYTYQWSNNGPADYQNSVTPDTTTTYILNSEDQYSCRGSDTVTVSVTELSSSNNGPICLGDMFDLEGTVETGTATSYSWTGPNGYTSSEQNPTGVPSPAAPGTYDYEFSATVDGTICTSTTSIDVDFCSSNCDVDSIRSAFTGAGCIELNACFSECSMYFLNPQSQTGSDAQTFAEGLGANLISLQSQAENDCILNALNTLGQTGTIWIGFNDEAVEDEFVWYDQSPVTYTNWASGEPNNSGGDEDCVQIYPGGSEPGKWNDLPCDIGNSQSIIEVNLCPVVNAGPDITICDGDTAVMQSTPTILGSAPYTYEWSNNGPTDYPNSVSPNATTEYILTSEDRYSCDGADTMTVEVNTLPVLDAGNDTTVCIGDSIILNVDGTDTYVWNNNITNGDPFAVDSSATYIVTATDNNACANTDTVEVTASPYPVPDFEGDELIGCKEHTVLFTNNDTLTNTDCLWEFGDGETSNVCDSVSHTYTESGTYDVTLTIESAIGCVSDSTVSEYIEVLDGPTADFTADPMITDLTNTAVDFTNESSDATNYTWDFGDLSAQVNDENPTHNFPNNEAGEYIVTLFAENDIGCVDTAFLNITIVFPDIIYSIPNVFTPNGDGDNDVFKLIDGENILELEVVILNRWGNVVFESNKADFNWNGLVNNDGAECTDGTYFYKMKLKNLGGTEEVKHGFVQLSRGQ